MLYPLLEQYDIDCQRAIAYGFSRTEAGFELKKELLDVGLYAIFVISGKRFEVNVFDAYTDEEYLPFMLMLISLLKSACFNHPLLTCPG